MWGQLMFIFLQDGIIDVSKIISMSDKGLYGVIASLIVVIYLQVGIIHTLLKHTLKQNEESNNLIKSALTIAMGKK